MNIKKVNRNGVRTDNKTELQRLLRMAMKKGLAAKFRKFRVRVFHYLETEFLGLNSCMFKMGKNYGEKNITHLIPPVTGVTP